MVDLNQQVRILKENKEVANATWIAKATTYETEQAVETDDQTIIPKVVAGRTFKVT